MSDIEQKVMGNVAAIYAGRKFVSVTAIKLYVLGVSLIAIVNLVSVPHIVENLMQVPVGGVGTFILSAILNTKLFVQIGLLVAILIAASFVVQAFQKDTGSRFAL